MPPNEEAAELLFIWEKVLFKINLTIIIVGNVI